MPDPSVTASGERFARDMRRIREAHGVSMEDIHAATMISTHIIESFEEDGLFEHPTFNRVYLRSFIRSYATAADMNPEDALEHLERALAGTYANELAVAYLEEEPAEPPDPGPPEAAEGADDAPGPASPSEAEASSSPPAGAGAAERPDEPVGRAPAAPPTPDETPSAPPETPTEQESRQGILIGIGVVLLAVIAWVLVDVFRGPAADGPPNTGPAAADTTDTTLLQVVPTDSLAAGPTVALGDTMYFTLIAQQRLNPIRIRRDDDLRRPYYFNRGQAGVFPAQEQIVIDDGNLASIRLLVNGYEYPAAQRAVDGRLLLTRDTVISFLDTTASDSLSLIVPADTFPVLGN